MILPQLQLYVRTVQQALSAMEPLCILLFVHQESILKLGNKHALDALSAIIALSGVLLTKLCVTSLVLKALTAQRPGLIHLPLRTNKVDSQCIQIMRTTVVQSTSIALRVLPWSLMFLEALPSWSRQLVTST